MNKKLFLIPLFAVAALVGCQKKVAETQNLNISIPSTELTKSLDGYTIDGAITPGVKNLTLYFWKDDQGTAATPPSRTLSTDDIALAVGSTGLNVIISTDVTHVSMKGNIIPTGDDILDYQGIADINTFKTKIPIGSGATVITTSGENKSVVLSPTASMARFELTGKIEPTVGYEYVKVDKVFINNYLLTSDAATPKFTTKDANWDTEHAAEMTTALVDGFVPANKSVAYQIFPTPATKEKSPHIILQVSFKTKATVVGGAQTIAKRFITVSKYGVGNAAAAFIKFEGGTVYKMSLADFSKYFTTDDGTDNGKPVDPTDDKPEVEKADLNIKVTPVAWSVVNITPGI